MFRWNEYYLKRAELQQTQFKRLLCIVYNISSVVYLYVSYNIMLFDFIQVQYYDKLLEIVHSFFIVQFDLNEFL